MKLIATIRVLDWWHIADDASNHATARAWRQIRSATARRYTESRSN